MDRNNGITQDLTPVLFNERVANETFLLGLCSEKIAASAKPGQFVMIRIRPGVEPLLGRPFSIAGIRGENQLLILYKVVGRGTALLGSTKEGERLSVLGPLGKGFTLPKNGQLPILVAGGLGVAPLTFLAQTLKTRPAQFMAGFRSADEIIPVAQIVDLPGDIVIATDDGTSGHGGLVTDLLEDFVRQHLGEKEGFSVFTCGPGPMVKKVAGLASHRGLPCQVSLETTMACGLGACQGCAIKASELEGRAYLHVCKDGPVFPIEAVDWKVL